MDDLTAVAAAFAVLVAIGGALYYFFKWQPVHKPWCVILYHVSRDTNASFDWPNPSSVNGVNALDVKLDQVVGVLDSLPCASVLNFVKSRLLGASAGARGVDWEDVHVVYRAVWNDTPFRPPGSRARARIVTWRPDAPSWPEDQLFGLATGGDRNGFMQWAYQNCPADHYALFYWGHSIGPGGLFELNTSVQFPPIPGTTGLGPASLIDVGTTLELLQELRLTGTITPAVAPGDKRGSDATESTGGTSSSSGGASGAPGPPANPQIKADVVLFQDCWMATLETAFELQDLARYIVGSQSLVPIGYTFSGGTMTAPTGPVWPYEAMIARMLANPNGFIDSVANELRTFYADVAARAPFPVSTVSVLDLGIGGEVQTVVRPPIQALVGALSMLNTTPYGGAYAEAYRWAFLAGGGEAYVLHPNNGRLQAGDWALRDVLRLCRYLEVVANHPSGTPPAVTTAVRTAATAALNAIAPNLAGQYSLVRTAFTAPADAPALFEGVSILWMPGKEAAIPPHDGFLAKQVDTAFYQNLRLVSDTTAGDSWAKFAFEQLS